MVDRQPFLLTFCLRLHLHLHADDLKRKPGVINLNRKNGDGSALPTTGFLIAKFKLDSAAEHLVVWMRGRSLAEHNELDIPEMWILKKTAEVIVDDDIR